MLSMQEIIKVYYTFNCSFATFIFTLEVTDVRPLLDNLTLVGWWDDLDRLLGDEVAKGATLRFLGDFVFE